MKLEDVKTDGSIEYWCDQNQRVEKLCRIIGIVTHDKKTLIAESFDKKTLWLTRAEFLTEYEYQVIGRKAEVKIKAPGLENIITLKILIKDLSGYCLNQIARGNEITSIKILAGGLNK